MTKRDTSTDLRSKMDRLDECMRAIYNCSFQEFLDRAFRRGYEKGKQKGRAAGRRAAKGPKEPPKKRGLPSEIDEDLRALQIYLKDEPKRRGRPQEISDSIRSLLVYYVDNREPGETIGKAVSTFLDVMRAAGKGRENRPYKLPTRLEAVRAYYRDRKKRKSHLTF